MSRMSHEKATLHLRKLCVGIDSVAQLREWQRLNLPLREGKIWHITRCRPKQAETILKGGSLFWIIKGVMCLRQPVVGFEDHPSTVPDERLKCRILLGPDLIETQPWPQRPFQGWRYLKPEDAPPDLNRLENTESDSMPAEMMAELKTLGLL